MNQGEALVYTDTDGKSDVQKRAKAQPIPTPSENTIPIKHGTFETLTDALDYAAGGVTGFNFYNRRGGLTKSIPYSRLRKEARTLARKILFTGAPRGSHMAIVANTHPDFIRFFFACQYAGMVPVPLPIFMHFSGAEGYVKQVHRLLKLSGSRLAVATSDYLPFLKEASKGLEMERTGSPEDYHGLPESNAKLEPLGPEELAYLQFTSGSTRFPKGVMVSQKAVMNNINVITHHGINCQIGDRAVSWLPFYHDMGLVGLVLASLGSQLSVDFFSTADFAMRPGLWIRLMSENRGTISFSPPFGYELAAMRLRQNDIETFDLSCWRVAGIGAEMIRPELLERFAQRLEVCGFDKKAFMPCYGMAECSLAVSFSKVGEGLKVDRIDQEQLAEKNLVKKIATGTPKGAKVKEFVRCGRLLPGFEAQIRDEKGQKVDEGQCGTLFLKGPSLMEGYFNDPEATKEVLSEDGWLNTGDVAFISESEIVITGRSKDLIIINGRNIWPQDIEYLAETMDEVRIGDACAFSLAGEHGKERAVVVVQLRNSNGNDLQAFKDRLKGLIATELGIECHVEIVPRNTLVRTTSGKPSRSGTKKRCLKLGLIHLD